MSCDYDATRRNTASKPFAVLYDCSCCPRLVGSVGVPGTRWPLCGCALSPRVAYRLCTRVVMWLTLFSFKVAAAARDTLIYGFRRYNCVPAATPCHCQHAAGPAKGYDDKAGYADGTCTRPAAGGVPGRGSALPPLRGTSSSLRAPIWVG
eukprot:scaffold115771_cov69-Phaeocystis_antarctica.AAC.1